MTMPLNPQEAAYLQSLHARATAAGQLRSPQAPFNLGPGPQATMSPPDRLSQAMLADSNPPMDLSRPLPRVPISSQIGLILSDWTASFTTLTINTAAEPARLAFDSPAVAYALVGAVFDGTTAFPAGQDPRNLFRIQFQTVGSAWLYQTVPTLGGNVVGTAQFPRLLSGPAWYFNTGSVLLVTITPLIADLNAIDITVYLLREMGPTNMA